MPYFVVAIHTDSTTDREYGIFERFEEAEAKEREMEAGRRVGDNYIVRMLFANDAADARERIRALRLEQRLPVQVESDRRRTASSGE